jgi:hypothetical protein
VVGLGSSSSVEAVAMTLWNIFLLVLLAALLTAAVIEIIIRVMEQ